MILCSSVTVGPNSEGHIGDIIKFVHRMATIVLSHVVNAIETFQETHSIELGNFMDIVLLGFHACVYHVQLHHNYSVIIHVYMV